MTSAARARLTALSTSIKREWLNLLHAEPAVSPLGRPETLVYLMDTTLGQLLKGLEQAADASWLRHCVPVAGSVRRPCSCGLNPLLKYFATGELALRSGAGIALGEEIEPVIAQFRRLGSHEIECLCAICQHAPRADCELPPRPPGA